MLGRRRNDAQRGKEGCSRKVGAALEVKARMMHGENLKAKTLQIS
jgi:hypothetical protein